MYKRRTKYVYFGGDVIQQPRISVYAHMPSECNRSFICSDEETAELNALSDSIYDGNAINTTAKGYVSKYKLDKNGIRVWNIYTENKVMGLWYWLANFAVFSDRRRLNETGLAAVKFLYDNYFYAVTRGNVDHFDLLITPRATGVYEKLLYAFLNNEISYEYLIGELKGQRGKTYMFRSQAGVNALEYVGFGTVYAEACYDKWVERERSVYDKMKTLGNDTGKIFISKIINGRCAVTSLQAL